MLYARGILGFGLVSGTKLPVLIPKIINCSRFPGIIVFFWLSCLSTHLKRGQPTHSVFDDMSYRSAKKTQFRKKK